VFSELRESGGQQLGNGRHGYISRVIVTPVHRVKPVVFFSTAVDKLLKL